MDDYTILKSIFSISHILIYLLFINLITFLAMWLDKKKAQKGKWRISEHALFVLVLLGGGLGGTVGMYRFRHKTKKPKFYIGFPTIFLVEMGLLIYLFIQFY